MLHSYRTLRQGKEMKNPKIAAIAEAHGRTPAQILGRWCVQLGIVYLPKSENKDRMVENMKVFDFELTGDEMATLSTMTTKVRCLELYDAPSPSPEASRRGICLSGYTAPSVCRAEPKL